MALPGDVVDEVAAERVGAPGTVFGVTATDDAEASDVYAPFDALTVNV